MNKISYLFYCVLFFSNTLLALEPNPPTEGSKLKELRGLVRERHPGASLSADELFKAASLLDAILSSPSIDQTKLIKLLTVDLVDYNAMEFIVRTADINKMKSFLTNYWDSFNRFKNTRKFKGTPPDGYMRALFLLGLRIKYYALVKFAFDRLPRDIRADENQLVLATDHLPGNQVEYSNKGLFHYLFEWFPTHEKITLNSDTDAVKDIINLLMTEGFKFNKTMMVKRSETMSPLAHRCSCYRSINARDLLEHAPLPFHDLIKDYPLVRAGNATAECARCRFDDSLNYLAYISPSGNWQSPSEVLTTLKSIPPTNSHTSSPSVVHQQSKISLAPAQHLASIPNYPTEELCPFPVRINGLSQVNSMHIEKENKNIDNGAQNKALNVKRDILKILKDAKCLLSSNRVHDTEKKRTITAFRDVEKYFNSEAEDCRELLCAEIVEILLNPQCLAPAIDWLMASNQDFIVQAISNWAAKNPQAKDKFRRLFTLALEIRNAPLLELMLKLLADEIKADESSLLRNRKKIWKEKNKGVFQHLFDIYFKDIREISRTDNKRQETIKLAQVIELLETKFDVNKKIRRLPLPHRNDELHGAITAKDRLLQKMPPELSDILREYFTSQEASPKGMSSVDVGKSTNYPEAKTSKQKRKRSLKKNPGPARKKRKLTKEERGNGFYRISRKYLAQAYGSSLDRIYFHDLKSSDQQPEDIGLRPHYELHANNADILTTRNNISCEKIEKPNSFSFTYCWKKSIGQNGFADIQKSSKRHTFVMAGREEIRVPRETDGGRVVLVLTKEKDHPRLEGLIKDHQDALFIEDLYSYSQKIPQSELSLVTSRRLASLYFAQELGLLNMIMLDDNIKDIYVNQGLFNELEPSWQNIYDFLSEASTQGSNTGILGVRGYDHRKARFPSDMTELRLKNNIASKIYFLNTDEIFKKIVDRGIQVYHLLPRHLNVWGEDVFLNFAIRALGLMAMTVERDAAIFKRNLSNVSLSDRNACAKVVKDASFWVTDREMGEFYAIYQNLGPSYHAYLDVAKLVQENIDHYKKKYDRFANTDLGKFTADRNLKRRPWYKDYMAPPISPKTGPISLASLAINNKSYLREYQKQVVKKLLEEHRDRGYIEIATGAGKTRIILSTIASLNYRNNGDVAIVVPTRELVEQVYEAAVNFGRDLDGKCVLDDQSLCLDIKKIIKVNAHNVSADDYYAHEYLFNDFSPTQGNIVILCQMSFHNLMKRARRDKMPLRFKQIFVDELHTIPDSRESIYTEAKNIFGFSATAGEKGARIFKERLLEYGTEHAIMDGVLAPFSTYVLDDNSISLNELPKKLKTILQKHEYKKPLNFDEELDRFSLPRGIIYVNNNGSFNMVDRLCTHLNSHSDFRAKGVLSSKPYHEIRNIVEDFKHGRINVLVADRMLTLGFDAKVNYIMVLKAGISLDQLIQMRGRSLRKHDDDNKVAALILTKRLLGNLAKDQNDNDIENRIRYSQEHKLSKQGLYNIFKSSKENKEWLKSYMEKTYGISGLKIRNILDNFYLIATGRSTIGGFSLADQKPAIKSLFYDFVDGAIGHAHEKIMGERRTMQNYQGLFDEFIAIQH